MLESNLAGWLHRDQCIPHAGYPESGNDRGEVVALDDCAHLLIKGARMRISVKDQGFGSHRPGQIDRMLPEEFTDALANESWFDLLCGQGDSTELEQHCQNVFGEPGAGDLSVTDRVNADTEPCGTLASSRSAKERADLCATVRKTDHNLVASRDYLVDAQMHVGESASGVGGHELFVGLDAPDLSKAAALPDHVCGPQLVDQVLPAAVDDFVEEAAHNCDVAAVVLIIGGYVNHCPLHLFA
jgi:hypothetical protein